MTTRLRRQGASLYRSHHTCGHNAITIPSEGPAPRRSLANLSLHLSPEPVLLSDIQISVLAQSGMIDPFVPELVREENGRKVLSYGCSSYGYDLRLSPKEFWTFRRIPGEITDPKDFNPATLAPCPLYNDPVRGSYFVLPAHSYGLGVTVERLQLPNDVTALFIGKSTYARTGVIANLTPGEAGWKGHLTLEFSNSSGADVKMYANEGVVQALFYRGEPCNTCYHTRSGKYQDQPHRVVLAKV